MVLEFKLFKAQVACLRISVIIFCCFERKKEKNKYYLVIYFYFVWFCSKVSYSCFLTQALSKNIFESNYALINKQYLKYGMCLKLTNYFRS